MEELRAYKAQRISLGKLCGWFGITRQAYYKHQDSIYLFSIESQLIVEEVKRIRLVHRRMGCRKLYEMLEPFMLEHGIKIGRDALFDILRINGLLIRKTRKGSITTNSKHLYKKYKNLCCGYIPSGINNVWVSDITYWRHSKGFYYISFITDAYSRKILGYEVATNLESIHSLNALKMAIKTIGHNRSDHYPLIHHSDRGIQYCCHVYVNELKKHNIKISMTESGDPLENPIAERVNGVVKLEYLNYYNPKTIEEAKEILDKTINLYNEIRPHMSLGMLTPVIVHQYQDLELKNLWKNQNKISTFVNPIPYT